jgi:hypothetical protein
MSAFYHGGGIETRVRLLLDPPDPAPPLRGPLFAAIGIGALTGTFIASAPIIHAAMEALVRLVP